FNIVQCSPRQWLRGAELLCGSRRIRPRYETSSDKYRRNLKGAIRPLVNCASERVSLLLLTSVLSAGAFHRRAWRLPFDCFVVTDIPFTQTERRVESAEELPSFSQ